MKDILRSLDRQPDQGIVRLSVLVAPDIAEALRTLMDRHGRNATGEIAHAISLSYGVNNQTRPTRRHPKGHPLLVANRELTDVRVVNLKSI